MMPTDGRKLEPSKKESDFWQFLHGLGYVAGCYLAWVSILCGVQAFSDHNAPKITSRSQLEDVLARERKHVGIDDGVSIHVAYGRPRILKISETEYNLRLPTPSSGDLDVATVQHELFHIRDAEGDFPRRSWLQYLFWDEPRATIYQATGINLAE